MKLWHPLKLAGAFYIVADISLLWAGLGFDNWLFACSGICGLLGNAALLLGGSGARKIDVAWLRTIAPYAERLSLAFYVLQNISFGLACGVMYETVIWTGVAGGFLGLLGSLAGIFIKSRLWGFLPYQVAGFLWFAASAVGIVAGFDVQNPGVVLTNVMLVLGAVCVMVSHRAEFRPDRS